MKTTLDTIADFFKTIKKMGMNEIKHPIFYNCPIALRFEIGPDINVYFKGRQSAKHIPNPEYISAAFDRSKKIYESLPSAPNILRIDCYPDEKGMQKVMQEVCQAGNLPLPEKQIEMPVAFDRSEQSVTQLQLYWNLDKFSFTPDILIKEIIKSDIGGCNFFAGSVYFVDTKNSILFYLYDDRGADLASNDIELLRPIYEKFYDWILEYDKSKIDEMFSK